jgi:succinoglycan biosynthesis protein ExoM
MEMSVSVCVCTFQRPLQLLRTLQSIDRQRLIKVRVAEVVIVDNDAAASARNAVAEFSARSRHHVRYVVEPNKGLSAARNRILREAIGQWLAFIDDDEVASEDWIEALADCAQSHGADAVIGAVCPQFETAPPDWILQNGSFNLWLPPTGCRVEAGDALTGNALLRAAYLKTQELVFSSIFDETGGEDTDFFCRFVQGGGIVVSAREAVVYEIVPDQRVTENYLKRRAVRQGEIHAIVTCRHGSALAVALDFGKACMNIVVAAIVTAVCLPFGRATYHRFYLLLLRNVGRLRYFAGFSPTVMYR